MKLRRTLNITDALHKSMAREKGETRKEFHELAQIAWDCYLQAKATTTSAVPPEVNSPSTGISTSQSPSARVIQDISPQELAFVESFIYILRCKVSAAVGALLPSIIALVRLTRQELGESTDGDYDKSEARLEKFMRSIIDGARDAEKHRRDAEGRRGRTKEARGQPH